MSLLSTRMREERKWGEAPRYRLPGPGPVEVYVTVDTRQFNRSMRTVAAELRHIMRGTPRHATHPVGGCPVVGGPCGGQRVRNIGGAPREAVLFRIGENPLTSPGHDYWWDGQAYVPEVLT